MLKKEIEYGHFYTARVGNTLTVVRIDRPSHFGGWEATNMRTGRQVRIKSAQKLRKEVSSEKAQWFASARTRRLAETK